MCEASAYVLRNGQEKLLLSGLDVIEQDGDDLRLVNIFGVDEAAQNTLRRVGKFPPFPPDLNRQKLTIEVPLAFRLRTE